MHVCVFVFACAFCGGKDACVGCVCACVCVCDIIKMAALGLVVV